MKRAMIDENCNVHRANVIRDPYLLGTKLYTHVKVVSRKLRALTCNKVRRALIFYFLFEIFFYFLLVCCTLVCVQLCIEIANVTNDDWWGCVMSCGDFLCSFFFSFFFFVQSRDPWKFDRYLEINERGKNFFLYSCDIFEKIY